MILTICPYYEKGRKCTHKDYCCEKVGNNCMSDMYYAIDLATENRHLNDLLNQALKEKEEIDRQNTELSLKIYNQLIPLQSKLEKIKEICKNKYDYNENGDKVTYIGEILGIIEGE